METHAVDRVLADLIEAAEDGRAGFAQAAEKLTEEGRDDLAERMRARGDQRGRFAAELAELATTKGTSPAGGGSLVAALHRGWISLRDVVGGADVSGILAAAAEGEDQSVREYEKALDEDLPDDVRMLISRQASEVHSSQDEVREMWDSVR